MNGQATSGLKEFRTHATPVPQQPEFESNAVGRQSLTVASGELLFGSDQNRSNIGMQFRRIASDAFEVRIAEDGAITVMEGSPDIGGSRASMALMAAESLGVPYERVKGAMSATPRPPGSATSPLPLLVIASSTLGG